jgi:two-component system, LytTR family, response regulator LytT
MKIVIIEDEFFAAKRLINILKEHDGTIEITAWLESVNDSVEWFLVNPQPDLIFLDIHLEDDLCFTIFDRITVTCPIVFTTATDDLAVKAFILKGIDYLHKPIAKSELISILGKYQSLAGIYDKIIGKGFFNDLFDQKI